MTDEKKRYNLDECMQLAWSIENREAHGAKEREIEQIGDIRKGNRVYRLYIDSSGAYWYETLYRAKNGRLVSQYRAIFGKPERKRKK